MTASTQPASPGATQSQAKLTSIHAALDSAGGDVDQAVANVEALFTKVEGSSEVTAVKSFIGTVLKTGRGGAGLALLAAAPAAYFLGPMSALYMLAVVAVLILSSPGAKSLATGEANGVKGWEIMLSLLAAGAAGAGLLWALNNGAVAIVSKLL